MTNSSPPKRARKSFRPQAALQALRHELDQLVAGLMAERVVDVLETIDVDIGGDGAIVVGLELTAMKEAVDPLDHMHAVRQAGERVVLGFVPGLSLALGQFVGGAAEDA